MSGILYRARQFWRALKAKPTRQGMAEAREILPDELFALFVTLQPSEIAHSISVLHKVRAESDDQDLLTAALLHDVGKIVQPLQLWERVLVVIAQRDAARRVIEPLAGSSAPAKPEGLGRALIVAEKHPAWGAQLAFDAGASQTVVQLIRRHQDKLSGPPRTHEDRLLMLLQAADNDS